jgi:ABC-2 type transport system permease protein
VNWPIDQIVWNPYNPHPSLDYLDPEILFIGNGSGAPGGAFGADPVSSGLQEIVLLFGGLLKARGTKLDVEFQPLLRTNEEGGTLGYRDILTPGLMGMPQLNNRRPYFATGQSYVTAARIRGKAPEVPVTKDVPKPDTAPPVTKGLNVIMIADLDMISDQFFAMRRKPTTSLDQLNFDNVTFILNCVDSLAGDDSFLALRKRRPVHRTLEAIERESRRFVDASQNAVRKADDAAKTRLAEAQKRLDDKVKAVDAREDMDPRTKDILLAQQQAIENRRLDVEKATIEAEADRVKELAASVEQQGIRGIHSRAKLLAVLIPPLPILLLGLVVFLVRHGRENRGASPNRLA